ncbi:MAG TPA: S8 family serine peptidase, partial [Lentisphaeria bacterium]|nr:S8 family serine peptidase [Lentisphaeria bacterium]
SPLHSMNRLDPATGANFVNRYLVLANIGTATLDGLEVPLAAEERVLAMPEWTVEAWVKAVDPALASGALVRRAVGNNLGYELGLHNGVPYVMYQTAKKTSIRLDFGAADDKGNVIAPQAIPAGAWVHLAASWDPVARALSLTVGTETSGLAVVRRVFNVTELDYLPVDGSSFFSLADPMENGGIKAWRGDVFLDEVRIWTVVRSLVELDDNRTQLIQTGTPDLFRCFRFDDGGMTIEDFAHPGWKSAETYAIAAADYGVAITPEATVNDAILNSTAEVTYDDGTGMSVVKTYAEVWADYAAGPLAADLFGVADWLGTTDALAFRGIDDADADGMPDWFENVYGIDDAAGDEDGDGLTNLYEYLAGTAPNNTVNGTADFHALAIAGDGLTNAEKQAFGLDPRLADSDGDGYSDYEEVYGQRADGSPVDGMFRRPDKDSFAADPLRPLSNTRPVLRHLVMDGTALTIPPQARHALPSWTIMAMVKPESISAVTLFKRQVSANGVNFELGWTAAGMPYASFTPNGPAATAFRVPENDVVGLAIEAGVWTHLAASYDAEARLLTLYVNGMPVVEREDVRQQFTCPAFGDGILAGVVTGPVFNIGAGLVGAIDNIRVYGSALPASQIYRDHRTSLSSNEAAAAPYGEETGGYRAMEESASEMLGRPHRAGQLIVKFKPGVSAKAVKDAHAALGTTVVKTSAFTGVQLVQLPAGADDTAAMATAIEQYRAWTDRIEYVEPNYELQPSAPPNDAYFANLWAMYNVGQTGGTPGADINVMPLWDAGYTGSRDVVVAVIDTGVDYTHPDLQANMWINTGEIPDNGIDDDGNGFIDDVYGYDFYNGHGDPLDVVEEGGDHGTHCAGTIGAVGNNMIGVAGVNWNVRIMALKFLGPGGGSAMDAISCIEYAVQMGAHISNNSWGGYGYSNALYDACRRALAAGHLLICAAGNEMNDNDGPWQSYPASYDLPNILAVAATDHNDEMAWFSNWGATTVDVGAPGYDILSTAPGRGYQYMSGTSMAAPHVTGIAALLKSRFPNATALDLKEAIMAGATPVPSLTGITVTGGRVNAQESSDILAARDMVLCLRGNGLIKVASGEQYVLDLSAADLGARAPGFNGSAPAIGRRAVPADDAAAADTVVTELGFFSGDGDSDGMPEWYEVAAGHDPGTQDGTFDNDGDGLTNYFEFLAGTSPWNTVSFGATLDQDTFNPVLNQTYNYLQSLGYHPLTGLSDAQVVALGTLPAPGFADYYTILNQDDDWVRESDTAAVNGTPAASDVADVNASNPLLPYTSRVLIIPARGGCLELPNQPRFVMAAGWSIDAWVKPAAPPMAAEVTAGRKVTIIRREIDTNLDGVFESANYELGLKAVNAGSATSPKYAWKPYVAFTSAVFGSEAPAVLSCEAAIALADGTWSHIGGIYNPGAQSLTVLVDNKNPRVKSVAGVTPVADAIGVSRVRVGAGFVGAVDAVRIWNIAKADFSDYLDSSTSTLPATPTLSQGLVAYYIFDDGGVTAQDFASPLDDWNLGWLNAAKPMLGASFAAEISPVTPSDVDTDGDGMPDWWETLYGLDPYNPYDADEDLDGDGLTNLYEYLAGTNPTIRDTDGNGISDANEDPDGDGLTNLEEQGWGSHPALADSDDDGINDKIEVMFGASPIHPMSIIVDGDGNRLTDAVIAALPVSGVLVPQVGADV